MKDSPVQDAIPVSPGAIAEDRPRGRCSGLRAPYTNTIGASELIAVWKDPDFDPALPAYYYGRVIEIPTPRWTAYDAAYYKTKPLPGTTMELQERAFTSPIWYKP